MVHQPLSPGNWSADLAYLLQRRSEVAEPERKNGAVGYRRGGSTEALQSPAELSHGVTFLHHFYAVSSVHYLVEW
jgi:hypothetical protein